MALALSILGIGSLWLVRRLQYAWFALAHLVLALAALGSLTWHVLILPTVLPKAVAGGACGIWMLTTLGRLLRSMYRGRAAVSIGQVGQIDRVRARFQRPVPLFPGCYFYLYFPDAAWGMKLRGHAMAAAWIQDPEGSNHSTQLTFLMQRQGHIAALAKNEASLANVYIDGPYGHDLQLHEFENVVLAAKGIGIAGVLPYAAYLARRKQFDAAHTLRNTLSESPPKESLFRDMTRKVDLFRVLEDNGQQKWIEEELQALQGLDPENVRCACSPP